MRLKAVLARRFSALCCWIIRRVLRANVAREPVLTAGNMPDVSILHGFPSGVGYLCRREVKIMFDAQASFSFARK